MYITDLILNIKNKNSIEYYYDAEKFHKLLCNIFGGSREEKKFIFKIREDTCYVHYYVQSDKQMEYEETEGKMYLKGSRYCFIVNNIIDVDPYLDKEVLRFHLTCCPTHKVRKDMVKNENNRARLFDTQEERENWVKEKLESIGAEVVCVGEKSKAEVGFNHSREKGGRGFIIGYNYLGTLRIMNKEKLFYGIRKGIGSKKCYGMGLMMVQ